jgi:hypothetical protein
MAIGATLAAGWVKTLKLSPNYPCLIAITPTVGLVVVCILLLIGCLVNPINMNSTYPRQKWINAENIWLFVFFPISFVVTVLANSRMHLIILLIRYCICY